MELILALLFLFAIVCLPLLLLLGVYYACLFGVLGVVSWIFDSPKKPEPSYDPPEYASTWTVIDEIRCGDIKCLRFLLKDGENPNQCDETGETALMLAARKGWVEALQLLIEAGADLDAQNEAGQTALFLAVMKEHPEAVRVLIEAGADINAMTPNGKTPLDMATEPEIIRFLEAAGGF